MIKSPEFFNNVAVILDKKYFADVKYYRDNKQATMVHYSLELFNNGCLTYHELIKRLAKNCKDTKENLHNIVKEFITDFEGYKYL